MKRIFFSGWLLAVWCLALAISAGSQMLESSPLPWPDDAVDSGAAAPATEANAEIPAAAETPVPASELLPVRKLSPYYYSAYIMPLDKTEVDLGLILSATPGIDVGLGWGAVEKLMVAAKMAVAGASYTSGVRLLYNLRAEQAMETKPAISLLADWRYLNRRTSGDVKETIFRGNRVALGGNLSKNLGSLARALEANEMTQSWMRLLAMHAETFLEFQTGRERVDEVEFSRVEVGVRGGLEAELDPAFIMFLVYDSLPDMLTRDNYYLGLRFFSRPDFALEGRLGRIGNDLGINLSIAWLF